MPGIRIGLHARLAPAGRQARFGLAAAPSSPPSPPRGAAQLPRRTPRHPFISSRKLRALNDLNVIDRFLQAFITYIDSGFGLLGPDVGFLTATMIGIDIRSEEHTSELQSLMRNSYAVF